jgi:hypothetical protein
LQNASFSFALYVCLHVTTREWLNIFSVIALMLEAAGTSETSVNFYQTTWYNNPEDSHLHIFHEM